MSQKLKKAHGFACNCVISSHRIKCNTSFESSYEGLYFFFSTDELGAIYEDVMAEKRVNLMI